MTTRRKYTNNYSPKTIKKITAPLPCEPCADLKYTPDFTQSIMAVHKLSAAQVTGWFHQRGHSVFPR